MKTLKELDQEISQLNIEKRKLLEQQEVEAVLEFSKLNWIKNSVGYLRHRGVLPYGDNYKWEIGICHSSFIPKFEYHTFIPVYKSVHFITANSNFVYQDIDNYNPRFRASSVDDLIEFITKYPFKKLHFDLDEAKLLHFLYNRYEA